MAAAGSESMSKLYIPDELLEFCKERVYVPEDVRTKGPSSFEPLAEKMVLLAGPVSVAETGPFERSKLLK